MRSNGAAGRPAEFNTGSLFGGHWRGAKLIVNGDVGSIEKDIVVVRIEADGVPQPCLNGSHLIIDGELPRRNLKPKVTTRL